MNPRHQVMPCLCRSAVPHFCGGCKGFTLIEMIIVISIISALLAIIMPSTRALRESAMRRRAALEATALVQAAIRYKSEYSFWPGQVVPRDPSDPTMVKRNPALPDEDWHYVIVSRGSNTSLELNLDNNEEGIEISYVDKGDNSNLVYRSFARVWQESPTVAPRTNPLNPRGVKFLDLNHENNIHRVDFPDPWGQSYVLIMGLNPRTTFEHNITNMDDETIATHSISNLSAFAFSYGPPEHQGTNLIYSAGAGGGR